MLRTTVTLVIGIAIGAVLALAIMLAAQPRYRILSGLSMPALQQAVEGDGCEPFESGDLAFGRCPRIHLP